MNHEQELKVVFVGAGNVGIQAILTFALVHLGLHAPWRMFVVDFDLVGDKDMLKGYHRGLVGRFKAEAAVEMVSLLYGEETAGAFCPVVAAAQSVPGLIREADIVLNGVDSALDAACVSEEARNTLEMRMSTGVQGGAAVHTLEVMPKGFTLGEASYDAAAWADSARHECVFGTPVNTFAGVAQPFGTLTSSLAVQLFLSCNRNEERPRLIRVAGGELLQSCWSQDIPGFVRHSQEILLTYDHSLAMVWAEVALGLGVATDEVRLEFPVPLVTRRCANPNHGGLYRGFERQPVQGLCPECGEKTCCLTAPRDLSLAELGSAAQRSLRELYAPAGLRFNAWTKDGRSAGFHLPFRLGEVPALPRQ